MRADIHDGQEARNAPCNGPNTDAQDQLSPDRHIRLAPHGRSIQSTWSTYAPYIGEYVMHCHILDHEDSGMMAQIRAI